MSVLDVGCARGQLEKLCPGVEYVGCDMIPPESTRWFPFVQLDINAPSLPESLPGIDRRTFDAVVCSGIIEYAADPRRLIGWLSRWIEDGGHLIATYFNFRHIQRRARRWTGVRPRRHPDWANELTLRDLRRELTRCHLEVRRVIPTRQTWRPSPTVEATESLPTRLPARRPWTPLLAHQFILVAQRRT
jgi:SAM-dependent methyltransferase